MNAVPGGAGGDTRRGTRRDRILTDVAAQRPDGTPTTRRRADAERNVATILDAALAEIHRTGEVNLAAVARRAGVSRVTLYSHFPTREALLGACADRVISELDAVLSDFSPDEGSARDALASLLRSHWRTLNAYRNLYAACAAILPAARLRALHQPLFGRFKQLIERGQAEGAFRDDLPMSWMVATIYGLLHQAAEEVTGRRLGARQAGEVLAGTVLSAFRR